MHKGGFRFAALVALALAATHARHGVDLRPAGARPRQRRRPDVLRLPLILLRRSSPTCCPARCGGPATRCASRRHFIEVVRERWDLAHLRFALVGLGAWYLTYASFRNLKSFVPFVNRHLWDGVLEDIDRVLFFGHDPAVCCTTCSAPASRRTSSRSSTSPGSSSSRPRSSSRWSGRATPAPAPGTSPRSPSTGCWAWRRTSWCRRSARSTPGRRCSRASPRPT